MPKLGEIDDDNNVIMDKEADNTSKKERAVYNRLIMLCHTPNKHEHYIYVTSIKSSGLGADVVRDLVLNSKARKKKRRLSDYADERYFQVIAKVEKGKCDSAFANKNTFLLRLCC